MTKKKVVVIGGGNGSATSIVALKQNLSYFDISAVISMSDSGGCSGTLRKTYKVPPPGDIMRAVLAMSKYEFTLLKQIFYRNRLNTLTEIQRKSGMEKKPNLGNLFLTFTALEEGSFMHAVRALEESLETIGHVFPTTLDSVNLIAELNDGKIIKTEAEIDRPSHDKINKIKKVWLEPRGEMYVDAKKIIEEADYIVFGPGSLYTSVIAAILPNGFEGAINKSQAKLFYVCGNAYEMGGEAGPNKLSDFIHELQRYLPKKIDCVIYNNHELSPAEMDHYTEKDWAIIQDDSKDIHDCRVISGDYERNGGGLCAIKLGKILKELMS